MGRARKPTQLHVIEGTLNSTRHAGRESEPEVIGPLGPAPADWPAPAKVIWQEVCDLIPDGVAGKADRLIVELTVRILIKIRTGECTAALGGQLRSCLAALGLTPADRSRVSTSGTGVGDDEAMDRFFK